MGWNAQVFLRSAAQHLRSNGLLVPAGDAAALGDAVARVIADRNLAGDLAAAGQRAARPYTVEVQAESVVRFLARCYPAAGFGARLTAPATGTAMTS